MGRWFLNPIVRRLRTRWRMDEFEYRDRLGQRLTGNGMTKDERRSGFVTTTVPARLFENGEAVTVEFVGGPGVIRSLRMFRKNQYGYPAFSRGTGRDGSCGGTDDTMVVSVLGFVSFAAVGGAVADAAGGVGSGAADSTGLFEIGVVVFEDGVGLGGRFLDRGRRFSHFGWYGGGR